MQEPFIGVAVGGQCVPGGNPGNLLVWAITAHGRVSNFQCNFSFQMRRRLETCGVVPKLLSLSHTVNAVVRYY